MFFNQSHPLKTTATLILTLMTLSGLGGSAMATIIHSDGESGTSSPDEQTRFILDRASFLAFQGASTVQKLQSMTVDPGTQAVLKDYMASMIYIPSAMNIKGLPRDEDVLDEPWGEDMVRPEQYDEPVDAKAMEFGDSPYLRTGILKFLKPVNAIVTSPFGFRWGRPHQGIDMGAPIGTPIQSAESGKVLYSGWKQGYGQFIAVDHGYGYETHYAHCSKLLVKVGQVVHKGQVIGKVGSTGHSTGPHLHFEVVAKGVHQNPAKFLNTRLSVSHAR